MELDDVKDIEDRCEYWGVVLKDIPFDEQEAFTASRANRRGLQTPQALAELKDLRRRHEKAIKERPDLSHIGIEYLDEVYSNLAILNERGIV